MSRQHLAALAADSTVPDVVRERLGAAWVTAADVLGNDSGIGECLDALELLVIAGAAEGGHDEAGARVFRKR